MEQENRAGMCAAYDHVWRRVTPDVDPYAIPVMGEERQAAAPVVQARQEMVQARQEKAQVWQEKAQVRQEKAQVRQEMVQAHQEMVHARQEMAPIEGEALPCDLPEREMAPRLVELIASEFAARRGYLTLARWGGVNARLFRALAAEEERHARRLSALYYILTGETPMEIIPAAGELPREKRAALRACYQAECCSAQAYEELAKTPCFGEVFAALAQDERRHGAKLLQLLEQNF